MSFEDRSGRRVSSEENVADERPAELEPIAFVASWLAEHGYSIQRLDDGMSIADDEVTWEVRRVGGERWTVGKRWRDEDRGRVFTGGSADDVDRYLMIVSMNSIRRRLGVRPLSHGISTDRAGIAVPADGFALTGDLDRGFTMVENGTSRSWWSRTTSRPRDSVFLPITPPIASGRSSSPRPHDRVVNA